MRLAREHWSSVAYLPFLLLLFSGALLQGGVPFYRDILTHYYPGYVFLARAQDQGVFWPLWNPLVHAGTPFLVSYPLELLSVSSLGPLWALRVDAPLHILLAMTGAAVLGRRLGAGDAGGWAAGLFYGLSGFLLSSSNSMQFFHASAWAPWIIAALLRLHESPSPRRAAVLGLLVAVQISTMAVDVTAQTALACLVLLPGRPTLAHAGAGGIALGIALLGAAPTVLGTLWMMEGTARGSGFAAAEALDWSANGMVLLEGLVPHLFGNVRSFSAMGYWGMPFYGDAMPYFMSLYLGPGIVLLAALAGRRRPAGALWVLAALGLLLSLGENGPFAPVLPFVLRHFRFPIKFFFLVNLALCLLAGLGVERRAGIHDRLGALRYAPGLLFVTAALVIRFWPDGPARLFGGWLPELNGPGARLVAAESWPADFLRAGALTLAAALALRLPDRGRVLAALAVALDLTASNVVLNPTARRDFYALVPPLRAIVDRASAEGHGRWLSLSLNAAPGIPFAPWVAAANSDVVAYRVARQSMLGTSAAIDGLESALEVDHSFAPAGSTLGLDVRTVDRFRDFFPMVREANVRFVLSLRDLPDDLVALVGPVEVPGLADALRVYRVRRPLPRAFWSPRCEAAQPGARCVEEGVADPPPVTFTRIDPHTTTVRVDGPPGFVVMREGFHRDWKAYGAGPVELLRVNDRYCALPTRGGQQTFTLRFEPRWPTKALALAGLGLALAVLAATRIRPLRG